MEGKTGKSPQSLTVKQNKEREAQSNLKKVWQNKSGRTEGKGGCGHSRDFCGGSHNTKSWGQGVRC